MMVFENIPLITIRLFIISFIIILIIFTTFVIIIHHGTKYIIDFTINRFKKLPIPICIINLSKNKIVDCNDLLYNIIGGGDLKNAEISTCRIFSKFEDYLQIKNISKHDGTFSKTIPININGKPTILETKFTQIQIGIKKYLLMSFIDKTEAVNYVKCLGVFSAITLAIADKSPDGVMVLKYNGNNISPTISYINDSISKITGYSRDELIGRPLSAIFELNVDENTLSKINENIHSLKPTSIEYQYIKKNGEICWVTTDIIPITNQNIFESLSKLDYMGCICQSLKYSDNIEIYITIHQKDITESKKYEESSKSFIQKLQSIVKNQAKSNTAVILALTNLLKYKDKNVAINEALKSIGLGLDVDRAYIFKIYNKNNKQYMKRIYEWTKSGIKSEIDNSLINDVTFEEIKAYELYVNLISNKISKLYTEEIKDPVLKHTLLTQNIKTTIICPIFNESDLIGFVGLDDCMNENRIWDTTIEKSLRSLCTALSNVLLLQN